MECSAYISCGLAARTHAVEGGVHVLRDLHHDALIDVRVLRRHVDRQLGVAGADGSHPLRSSHLTLEQGIILQQDWGYSQGPVFCNNKLLSSISLTIFRRIRTSVREAVKKKNC